jgi:hypothetical protein
MGHSTKRRIIGVPGRRDLVDVYRSSEPAVRTNAGREVETCIGGRAAIDERYLAAV